MKSCRWESLRNRGGIFPPMQADAGAGEAFGEGSADCSNPEIYRIVNIKMADCEIRFRSL
jgi:hypothetical protein